MTTAHEGPISFFQVAERTASRIIDHTESLQLRMSDSPPPDAGLAEIKCAAQQRPQLRAALRKGRGRLHSGMLALNQADCARAVEGSWDSVPCMRRLIWGVTRTATMYGLNHVLGEPPMSFWTRTRKL